MCLFSIGNRPNFLKCTVPIRLLYGNVEVIDVWFMTNIWAKSFYPLVAGFCGDDVILRAILGVSPLLLQNFGACFKTVTEKVGCQKPTFGHKTTIINRRWNLDIYILHFFINSQIWEFCTRAGCLFKRSRKKIVLSFSFQTIF